MNLSQYIFYSAFYLIFWSKANPSPLDDLTINLNILDNGHDDINKSENGNMLKENRNDNDLEKSKSNNKLNNANYTSYGNIPLNNADYTSYDDKTLNNADNASINDMHPEGVGFQTGIMFGDLSKNGGEGLSLDGCIKEDNVAYWGVAIISMITSYGEGQCALKCSLNDICQFWVINKSNNLCLLKTNQFDKRNNNMYISGSKGCGAGGEPRDRINTANIVLNAGNEVVNRVDASNGGEFGTKSEANNGGFIRYSSHSVHKFLAGYSQSFNRTIYQDLRSECLDGVCGDSCNRALGSGPGICNGKGSCVHPRENPCAQDGCKGKMCEETCFSGDIIGLCDGKGSCEFDFEKVKNSCKIRK